MAWSDFSAKRATKRQSPIDVSSSALPKLPVNSSLVAVVPHMIIRSPRPQPRKFVFSDPQRVLHHNLPTADVADRMLWNVVRTASLSVTITPYRRHAFVSF